MALLLRSQVDDAAVDRHYVRRYQHTVAATDLAANNSTAATTAAAEINIFTSITTVPVITTVYG